MNCHHIKDEKNIGFYRASGKPGWAAYCKKCGTARLATKKEAEAQEGEANDG